MIQWGKKMSKIVEAINSMIKNKSQIEDVAVDSYFLDNRRYRYIFKYKHYIWSIEDTSEAVANGGYELKYYPGFTKVSDLLNCLDNRGMTQDEYVRYDSIVMNEIEAIESFRELYQVVIEKLHNVDKVLDDIISDM